MIAFSSTPGRWAALAVVGGLTLSGCNFQGAASLPLPGGVRGGYDVTVDFTDVLDLVPQSAVKVNDVTVGSVKSIKLSKGGYTAVVVVSVLNSVHLPADTTATLRQTSLLGEKFVSLDAPVCPAANPDCNSGSLKDHPLIDLQHTTENADIEEVLGALSLVLNGGSLEQLQVINSELTKALKGRETDVRSFLNQLTVFVTGLDEQKSQITQALDGLDRLSGKLAAQKQILDVALRDLPSGAAVLADEHTQITQLLQGLNNLGTVAVKVIQATQQNTVADLKALQPTLTQLANAGSDLPNALELLTTYPFPRTVASTTYDGKHVSGGIKGDYANLFISVDADAAGTIGNLTGGGISLPTVPLTKVGAKTSSAPVLPSGTSGTSSAMPKAVQQLNQRFETGTETALERLLFGGLT